MIDPPHQDPVSPDRQAKHFSSRAEFLVLLTGVIGASSAFAALLRVAIQKVEGPAEHLAHLAVGASILHALVCVMLKLTNRHMEFTRSLLILLAGSLLSGSLFGGLASIWH